MPAAVAVPAIIGAGATIATAKIGSDAAKGAAKTQERATDRVLQVNRQVYDDQRKLVDPYVQAGTVSLGNLMKQHWGGQGMPTGAPAEPRPVGTGRTAGTSLASMGGGRVRLQAPTGEVAEVPAYLADRAIARGARRI